MNNHPSNNAHAHAALYSTLGQATNIHLLDSMFGINAAALEQQHQQQQQQQSHASVLHQQPTSTLIPQYAVAAGVQYSQGATQQPANGVHQHVLHQQQQQQQQQPSQQAHHLQLGGQQAVAAAAAINLATSAVQQQQQAQQQQQQLIVYQQDGSIQQPQQLDQQQQLLTIQQQQNRRQPQPISYKIQQQQQAVANALNGLQHQQLSNTQAHHQQHHTATQQLLLTPGDGVAAASPSPPPVVVQAGTVSTSNGHGRTRVTVVNNGDGSVCEAAATAHHQSTIVSAPSVGKSPKDIMAEATSKIFEDIAQAAAQASTRLINGTASTLSVASDVVGSGGGGNRKKTASFKMSSPGKSTTAKTESPLQVMENVATVVTTSSCREPALTSSSITSSAVMSVSTTAAVAVAATETSTTFSTAAITATTSAAARVTSSSTATASTATASTASTFSTFTSDSMRQRGAPVARAVVRGAGRGVGKQVNASSSARYNTPNRAQSNVTPRLTLLESEDDGLTCRVCLQPFWYKSSLMEHLKAAHAIADPERYEQEERDKKMRRLRDEQQRQIMLKRQRMAVSQRASLISNARRGMAATRGYVPGMSVTSRGTASSSSLVPASSSTSGASRSSGGSGAPRPSFQYRDGSFICDLCKKAFSDGNEMVSHWKAHVKKQRQDVKLANASVRHVDAVVHRKRGRGGAVSSPSANRTCAKHASSKWSAYLVFSTSRRKELFRKDPELTFAAVSKRVSAEWKAMSDKRRAEFQARADDMTRRGVVGASKMTAAKRARRESGSDTSDSGGWTSSDSDPEGDYKPSPSSGLGLKTKQYTGASPAPKSVKAAKAAKALAEGGGGGEASSTEGAQPADDKNDADNDDVNIGEADSVEVRGSRSTRQRKRPSFFREYENEENQLDKILDDFEMEQRDTEARRHSSAHRSTAATAHDTPGRRGRGRPRKVTSSFSPVDEESITVDEGSDSVIKKEPMEVDPEELQRSANKNKDHVELETSRSGRIRKKPKFRALFEAENDEVSNDAAELATDDEDCDSEDVQEVVIRESAPETAAAACADTPVTAENQSSVARKETDDGVVPAASSDDSAPLSSQDYSQKSANTTTAAASTAMTSAPKAKRRRKNSDDSDDKDEYKPDETDEEDDDSDSDDSSDEYMLAQEEPEAVADEAEVVASGPSSVGPPMSGEECDSAVSEQNQQKEPEQRKQQSKEHRIATDSQIEAHLTEESPADSSQHASVKSLADDAKFKDDVVTIDASTTSNIIGDEDEHQSIVTATPAPTVVTTERDNLDHDSHQTSELGREVMADIASLVDYSDEGDNHDVDLSSQPPVPPAAAADSVAGPTDLVSEADLVNTLDDLVGANHDAAANVTRETDRATGDADCDTSIDCQSGGGQSETAPS